MRLLVSLKQQFYCVCVCVSLRVYIYLKYASKNLLIREKSLISSLRCKPVPAFGFCNLANLTSAWLLKPWAGSEFCYCKRRCDDSYLSDYSRIIDQQPPGSSAAFSLGGANISWLTTEEIPWVFIGFINKYCIEQEAHIQPY